MTYLAAVLIPLVLIFCGALAKKLVRGTKWVRADFFLGVELALASLASSMVYVFEISQANEAQLIRTKILAAGVFTVVCFFLLFLVMSIHQDWEKRKLNPRGQILWLGGICNLIGIASLAAFILLIKGVG